MKCRSHIVKAMEKPKKKKKKLSCSLKGTKKSNVCIKIWAPNAQYLTNTWNTEHYSAVSQIYAKVYGAKSETRQFSSQPHLLNYIFCSPFVTWYPFSTLSCRRNSVPTLTSHLAADGRNRHAPQVATCMCRGQLLSRYFILLPLRLKPTTTQWYDIEAKQGGCILSD